ncbi:MAG: methylenetetrahydrofolate reductase [NAD(P)H] [Lachnospiraceae bacterium]|nr:methylenetetrahydrofolate reductase [NAD(P)H] [Lachnospiraceae bacterium]
MKVRQILEQKKVTLSFEVFPPKKADGFATISRATQEIAALHPDFMSVTYGAGGGTSEFTVDIAKNLQNEHGVTVIPHLTCVSSSKEHVHTMIEKFRLAGLENIMALRGDIPEGGSPVNDYRYACELIEDIKEQQGDFCLGGACYPEGHPDTPHKAEDIQNLKRKVDAGLDFLTTQMFFDNNIFYNFLYRVREAGIYVPILPGIMPITNARQIERAIKLSGTNVPERFRAIVDRFADHPEAMKQAGIIYASEQIIDLIANGVTHIHVYSMNKPDVAEAIQKNISEILKQEIK